MPKDSLLYNVSHLLLFLELGHMTKPCGIPADCTRNLSTTCIFTIKNLLQDVVVLLIKKAFL